MKGKNWVYYVGVFLISPFISFLFALFNPKDKFSYNIIWLFTIFFGITYAIDYSSSSDVVKYLEEFNLWKTEGLGIVYLIQNSYGVEHDSYKDIFFPLISLFSAKLELSDILFLGLLGLIFGYFYSRVYKNLIENIVFSNSNVFLLILIAAFMLINPIWRGINGIRFSLAAIIFVYIIMDNYKNGFSLFNLLIISSLFLIHFSMLFPIGVFFLFYAIQKIVNIKILFFFFLFSFFVSSISLDVLNNIIRDFLPDFLHSRSDSYLRDSYLTEMDEKKMSINLYALIFLKSLFYSIGIMAFFIYYNYKKLIDFNPKLSYLIKFSILFAAIVNILLFIPSFSRMGLISNTLILYVFIILIANLPMNLKYLTLGKVVMTPMLLLYIVVQLRIGFDSITLETIFGNPIVALLDLDNTPLIDLIK